MQLSERTIEILRNFAEINQGILFTPGQILRTIKGAPKHIEILARARVKEKFPQEFAIAALPTFLAYMSECKAGHDIEFVDAGIITITDDKNRVCKFRGTDPQNITCVRKDFGSPSNFDATVTISEDDLKMWKKRAAILHLPELAFVGDGAHIWLHAVNTKKETGEKTVFHEFSYAIGQTDKTFQMVFSIDLMKFLPGDYEMGMIFGRLAHFVGDDVEYVVKAEVSTLKGLANGK